MIETAFKIAFVLSRVFAVASLILAGKKGFIGSCCD
jgi:hypothetical protein